MGKRKYKRYCKHNSYEGQRRKLGVKRIPAFLYGLAAYLVFLGAILYFVGFVGDLAVPKTVDSGGAAPLAEALLVDLGLLALFGFQHSVMARPAFKRRWTKIVPESLERSTYVLAASLTLAFLCWQWRPIAGTVWEVDHPAGRAVLWGVFGLGWLLALGATFLINHFHLFGLQQVWHRLRGRELSPPEFRTPGLYRFVRHPLNLAFLMAVWASPEMTWGHLLLAAGLTGYILVAIPLEERDLVRAFGDRYRAYRDRVPTLIPGLGGGSSRPAEGDDPA